LSSIGERIDDETRAALLAAEARASALESEAKHRALLIEKLKFAIAKLRHEQFGQSSERSAVLEQLELQLSELQENASEAEAAARLRAAKAKIQVESFERCKPARRPLPENLPRQRIVYPASRRGPPSADRGRRRADRRARKSRAGRYGTCPWPAPARSCHRHGYARPRTREHRSRPIGLANIPTITWQPMPG
jgi:hypothetical protein